METKSITRASTFTFKNNLVAQNRIVIPAMASQTSSVTGHPTEKTIEHYARLADSHSGIVLAEYTYVHSSGRSEENQLGLDDDSKIPGLTKISEAIKARGSIAGIQLTHAGGKSTKELTGGALMGPSEVAVPVKDQLMEVPRAMSMEDINMWRESFLMAARRAVTAGFDLIELHAAHGYGLNQWISPLTNKRQDDFGGTPIKRLKLLSEIIISIKKEFPHILLSVRIPGKDFEEEGLSEEDALAIAQYLEDLGVDLINVSSGIGGWRRPKERQGEGYLIPEAQFIQRKILTPVIGVGGIESGEYIDEILGKKSVSFVAVGRAILSDPVAWRKKIN